MHLLRLLYTTTKVNFTVCFVSCRCPTVRRRPETQPGATTVYNPANLTGQQWLVDPEYYWFMKCECRPVSRPL